MLERLLKRDYFPQSGIGSNETTGLSIYDWAKMFAPGAVVNYGGSTYQAFKVGGATVDASYYGSNPIVFACAAVRILLFAQARLMWQRLNNGQPGDLFGTADLEMFEHPWVGATESEMLAQAEMDNFAAGNSYWIRQPDGFLRLDPAKTTVVTTASFEAATEGRAVGDRLFGYVYKRDTTDPETWVAFKPQEVAHYKPLPDVKNRFVGQSWLAPCLGDVTVDETINAHKTSTIANGAGLRYVVSFDPTVSREAFDAFVDKFHREFDGPENRGKTLFFGAGADVKTVGQSFQDLSLQSLQGNSETRIAAAAGVPSAIVGFSEGLKGSSLNAGNYGEARRRLADGTLRPLWQRFAQAMENIVQVPGGARLWYDEGGVAFLREDLADQANILATNAQTIFHLIQAGYEPDACVDAVTAGDFSRLMGQHTGLFSVQLQPPGDGTMPDPDLAALPAPLQAVPAPANG